MLFNVFDDDNDDETSSWLTYDDFVIRYHFYIIIYHNVIRFDLKSVFNGDIRQLFFFVFQYRRRVKAQQPMIYFSGNSYYEIGVNSDKTQGSQGFILVGIVVMKWGANSGKTLE